MDNFEDITQKHPLPNAGEGEEAQPKAVDPSSQPHDDLGPARIDQGAGGAGRPSPTRGEGAFERAAQAPTQGLLPAPAPTPTSSTETAAEQAAGQVVDRPAHVDRQ